MRAPRTHAGSLDRAQSVDHQRRVAAVVERSGTQIPGIEMRAEDHELVRLLAAAEFRHDVRSSDRAADGVGNGKVGIELLPGGQQARHASRILAGHEHHGKAINFAVAWSWCGGRADRVGGWTGMRSPAPWPSPRDR